MVGVLFTAAAARHNKTHPFLGHRFFFIKQSVDAMGAQTSSYGPVDEATLARIEALDTALARNAEQIETLNKRNTALAQEIATESAESAEKARRRPARKTTTEKT